MSNNNGDIPNSFDFIARDERDSLLGVQNETFNSTV
jgi:hypothetical protein